MYLLDRISGLLSFRVAEMGVSGRGLLRGVQAQWAGILQGSLWVWGPHSPTACLPTVCGHPRRPNKTSWSPPGVLGGALPQVQGLVGEDSQLPHPPVSPFLH